MRQRNCSIRQRRRTRGYPRVLEGIKACWEADYNTKLEDLLKDDDILLPERVVQKLVGEAFSRLDNLAQKVMQALAIYNRPITPAAVDYLLQPFITGINSAPILNRLANMHFVRRESGRFYLHPVDREYSLDKVPETLSVTAGHVENAEVLEAVEESTFSTHDLTLRAADYFAQARKPRAEWKKMDDLAAQLAEFDLRCTAGDYDTAASVLNEIDDDYLLLWGHYRLIIDLHLRLKDKLQHKGFVFNNLMELGNAYVLIGYIGESISAYETGLFIAREEKDQEAEGNVLGGLGYAYQSLGDMHKAIELHEQSLAITRKIGNRLVEAINLNNLGYCYSS